MEQACPTGVQAPFEVQRVGIERKAPQRLLDSLARLDRTGGCHNDSQTNVRSQSGQKQRQSGQTNVSGQNKVEVREGLGASGGEAT